MKDADIIKGLIIGGILLWIITRRNDMSMQNMQQNLQQSHIGIYGWKPLNNIQDFDEFNSRLTQSVVQPIVQNAEYADVEQKVANVEQTDISSTAYKNEEKWKFMRDDNGDISEISVSRDAKVT